MYDFNLTRPLVFYEDRDMTQPSGLLYYRTDDLFFYNYDNRDILFFALGLKYPLELEQKLEELVSQHILVFNDGTVQDFLSVFPGDILEDGFLVIGDFVKGGYGELNMVNLAKTYFSETHDSAFLAHSGDYPEWLLDSGEFIEDHCVAFKYDGHDIVALEDDETFGANNLYYLDELCLNIEVAKHSFDLLLSDKFKERFREIISHVIGIGLMSNAFEPEFKILRDKPPNDKALDTVIGDEFGRKYQALVKGNNSSYAYPMGVFQDTLTYRKFTVRFYFKSDALVNQIHQIASNLERFFEFWRRVPPPLQEMGKGRNGRQILFRYDSSSLSIIRQESNFIDIRFHTTLLM